MKAMRTLISSFVASIGVGLFVHLVCIGLTSAEVVHMDDLPHGLHADFWLLGHSHIGLETGYLHMWQHHIYVTCHTYTYTPYVSDVSPTCCILSELPGHFELTWRRKGIRNWRSQMSHGYLDVFLFQSLAMQGVDPGVSTFSWKEQFGWKWSGWIV